MRTVSRRGDALAAVRLVACAPAQPLLAPCGFARRSRVPTSAARRRSPCSKALPGRRCQQNPAAMPCAVNNIRNADRNPALLESVFTELRDAGLPARHTWQILSDSIIEKNRTTGQPCLTPDGYLVSMTADVAVNGGFNRTGDCDQTKWIDALTVPAIVVPKDTAGLRSQFVQKGVGKRSLMVALSRSATRRVVPGIVGDLDPTTELGEATVAMNRALNGLAPTDQPKHRQDAIHDLDSSVGPAR